MMLKKYLHILLLLMAVVFLQGKLSAQIYGNEWIVSNQSYFKLKTAATGMYRVTYADLVAANVPIGTVNPKFIQLFHRGVEQNIIIQGEADGSFDPADALYFYGEINDGTMDSLLYNPDPSRPGHTYQPHKYYNLYNDTTAYFLTWGTTNSTHRMNQDNTGSPPPADPYHIEEALSVFTDNYWRGRLYGESTESFGDLGEGWFGNAFSSTYGASINISNVNTSGTAPTLELMLVGMNNNVSRSVDLLLGNPSSPSSTISLPVTSSLDGQGVQKFSVPIAFSDMTGSSLIVTVRANGYLNSIAVAYFKLRYPQTVNMNGAEMKYINLANPGSVSYIQLPWSSAAQPIVYDITDKNNIFLNKSVLASGTLSITFPATTTKALINSDANYLTVPSIQSSDLGAYATSADFLIITHKKLLAGAQEYEAYRVSAEGGSHTVLLADVDKIYDMFGYGEFSPVGIKRFCSYQIANNVNAKYLFIIGKGLDLSYFTINPFQFYRKFPLVSINNPDPTYQVENLVPTAGSPASDLLYTMDNSYKTRLSVGRIFAKTTLDVEHYLKKVVEHETELDSNLLWRKNLIHLSGGNDPQQVSDFRGYIDNYKSIVESSIFSGKVIHTYQKDLNSGTVDNQSISEDVNNGLSYITFFGHGSGNVYDLDIGFVSNPISGYTNGNGFKYPMLIVDGCYTAASFYSVSLAEDWMNTPEKGSILVLGSSDIGYTGTLDAYTTSFYIQNFNTKANIGKSIGEIQKIVVNNNGDEFSSMQMVLHGDPCIKMYSPSKADYEVSGTEVRADMPKLPATLNTYDGSKLTSVTDSFYVNIPIKNFGLYDTTAFIVTVKRTANGKEVTYAEIKYPPVRYLTTIQYPIPTNDPTLYGLNKFEVYIDFTDTVHEMREDNNIATIEYNMPISTVTCLFPQEYSIVHDQPVTFVAQSTDLLIQQLQYYVQYDTSYLFNSAYMKDTVINTGSLMKWSNQKLLNTDSTVYYWRVRFNDIPAGQDTLWSTSSFIYINGSPDGWSQARFAQFTKAKLQNLNLDVANKAWTFTASAKGVYLKTYGNGNVADANDHTELSVQGLGALMFAGFGYNNCAYGPQPPEISAYEIDGLVGMFFNKSSLDHYFPSNSVGNCGRFPKSVVSPFRNLDNIYYQNQLVGYIGAMQPGDFILLGSDGNLHADSWGTALKTALQSNFGAALLDSLHDNMSYILLAKKGATAPIFEKYNKDLNGTVTLEDTLRSTNNSGYIMSTIIGPASQWGNIYKKADSLSNDRIIYKVVGIKANGDTTTVLNNPVFHYSASRGEDTLSLQGLIDPKVYSSIRLIAYVYDSVNLTPPQLIRWQVIYHSVPEGTMDPFRAGLPQYTVGTRDEGDKICLTYDFENISGIPFDDSLKVRITVTNPNVGSKDTIFIISLDSLKPNQSVTFNYCLNSKGYGGNNTIRAYVNPNDYGFQPEQYYNNNVIEVSFDVTKDLTSPVIDVVFDGVHIIDGDVVSPSPLINIVLNDNSKYLLINNPNDIAIYLTRPNSKTVEQILPTDPAILRYGQTPGKTNSFSIEYNPQNLPDGIYTLQVQGKDVNGNLSGHLYTITFEVVNASTITNFYPYPNPFSSSTKFVFTLTGRFVPDDFYIEIMTISGKVVRQIMKAELGNIHIGNNKTDYSWDGTDEYGDKLGNGVYLYRIVIKNAGDNFQHRDTAGDKAFTKDFGKLVILR